MSTGQINDPGLSARKTARELRKKENLTLAEKLILASNEETIKYTYNGIELEITVPNSQELDKYLELFTNYAKQGTEDGPVSKVDTKAALKELAEFVAPFFVDDSITPEVIESGALGVSFLPKFQNEIISHEKGKAEEVTVIKGFRQGRSR